MKDVQNETFPGGETAWLIRRAQQSVKIAQAQCDEARWLLQDTKRELMQSSSYVTGMRHTLDSTRQIIAETRHLLKAGTNAHLVVKGTSQR